MTASSLRRVARPVAARVVDALTRWPPHSRLFLVGEGNGWVIDEELRALGRVAGGLGVRIADRRLLGVSHDQCAFYGSHFTLFSTLWPAAGHRLAVAYFHGRPGTPGAPEFDQAFRSLCTHHEQIDRLQVSHREMEQIVLESGIAEAKVFRIPIGIEPRYFAPRDLERTRSARRALGLPQDAFVVGSFQKDGTGWGEGMEPKLIKGPDVFLEVVGQVVRPVPELHVLLSGPARGYVRAGLERLAIPYVHRRLERYEEIGRLYDALDVYVVPARQEGGPKGVLEAMASGVPVVSTRVGQATDLVRDGENGWLVDVEDVEALADRLELVAGRPAELTAIVSAGLETVAANSYESQRPLWRSFFDGFVTV